MIAGLDSPKSSVFYSELKLTWLEQKKCDKYLAKYYLDCECFSYAFLSVCFKSV